MKANTNSLHAKLYNITYDSQLPNSLCPYFWKLVWAILVFIPNIVLQTPALINNRFIKYKENSLPNRRSFGFMIYLFIGFISIFAITVYHSIRALFNCYSYNSFLATIGGMITFVILAVIIIFLIVNYFEDRQYNKKPDGIITSFVKAKYNNYCPKIDWDKE